MALNARNYLRNLAAVTETVRATDKEGGDVDIDLAVDMCCDMIAKASGKDSKMIFIGNGGSAAISNHMAIDFWKNGGVRAVSFSDASLLTCIGNDFGYRHVFEKPIEMFANEGDVLFATSSSGKSENIHLGVEAGRSRGCGVITLSGFGSENPRARLGDINFYVPSGSYGPVEVIHQALMHCILDIYMVREGRLREEDFKRG